MDKEEIDKAVAEALAAERAEVRAVATKRGEASKSGSLGCLPVVFWIVVAMLGVGLVGGLQRAARVATEGPSPSDYSPMCAVGLVRAQRVALRLDGYSVVPADPVVLGQFPRDDRIQCAVSDRRGRIGAVTLDVLCRRLEGDCIRLISAVDGRGNVLIYPPLNTTR